MQILKIANFHQANPSETFPAFRHLDDAEVHRLASRLASRLRLPSPATALMLARRVSSGVVPVTGVTALSETFRLSQVLWTLQIAPPESVFINWHQFDDVDELRFSDVEAHFADLWYPSSDDIEIFDSSMNWLLSIAHDGSVGVCRT